MAKNYGYSIWDFKRAAYRGDSRSRRQAKTFGFIKREVRRAERRAGQGNINTGE